MTGILYQVFISPQWKDVEALRSEHSSRLDELKKTEEFRSKYSELRTQYARMIEEGLGEDINSIIPRSREIPEVLVQLEAIAAQTGSGGAIMRSIEFSTSPSQVEGSLDTLTIVMQFGATYEAFKEYLGRLSRNMRLFDVTLMSFSAISPEGLEEGESPAYDFQLELKAYFQR